MHKLAWFPAKRQELTPSSPDFRTNSLVQHERPGNNTVPLALASGITPKPYLFSPTKRIIDLTLSLILLIFFLPLLLNVALAIKLTSRGPIFFTQWRYSAGLRPFKIIKFRSMYVSDQDEPVRQATQHDPRVSPIGRFIRKTSIDELPQLLNVLRGEMSLVGPRPHPIDLDDRFVPHVDNYLCRYMVRPGITGHAQVNGARGETPTIASMAKRVEYDLAYIRSANILKDLRILCETVREVFFSVSAY